MVARRDRHHARARKVIDGARGILLLSTWPVVAEACHLVPRHAARHLLRWIAAGGLTLIEVPDSAKERVLSLIERYADRPMDVADATLLWLADSAGVTEILTLDESGFAAYRTPAGRRLRNRFF
jgi:hypothetical protein